MASRSQRALWTLIAAGSAVAAGIAARSAMETAWRKVRDEDPPSEAALDDDSQWPEALAWAATVGAIVGVARLLGRRGAAAGWQKKQGRLPRKRRSRR